MEDEWHMNQKTSHQILHEDLGKRKICRKSVSHSLADEQKNHKVTACEHFIQTYLTSPHFLNCTVIGDESWLCLYAPKTRHTMERVTKPSQRSRKFSLQKSRMKMRHLQDLEHQSSISLCVYICFTRNSLLSTFASTT
jgi:hypothetical protein